MQFSRKTLLGAAAVTVTLLGTITGCASSMIGERIGADKIVVAEPVHVTNCKSLGKATHSVVATVGGLPRFAEDVEANLVQMARNAAVDAGGDTVVKGASPEFGKRSFEVFKCKH